MCEIDALAPVYRVHCERLFLAQNYITSLAGLAQFAQLQHLSLSYNALADLGELRHLRPLANSLQALALDGNPLSQHPAYRHCCLALLPRLRTLDARPVTIADRQDVGASSCVTMLCFKWHVHNMLL